MILIITNKEDVHPTPVIKHLNKRGISVFRLNTECLLTDYEFYWQCERYIVDFYIRNVSNGIEIYGHDITAVWERRPENPKTLPLKNCEGINKHNLAEAREFLSFLLYYLSSSFCIGHHLYDRSAASKMLQLQIASELGMQVPATIFSNRKEDIVGFAKQYNNIVLKQIDNAPLWINDKYEYVFYTRKLLASQLEDQPEEAFVQTVSFVQNYIEKQFELRITVVCDDVFACKIDSQIMGAEKGAIDWRQGYDYGLRHEIYKLPESIAEFCRNFLQKMHLNFGCFDLIVTPNGEYVFLECNPNGQWLWIEDATGLSISEAIATNLANPPKKYE